MTVFSKSKLEVAPKYTLSVVPDNVLAFWTVNIFLLAVTYFNLRFPAVVNPVVPAL